MVSGLCAVYIYIYMLSDKRKYTNLKAQFKRKVSILSTYQAWFFSMWLWTDWVSIKLVFKVELTCEIRCDVCIGNHIILLFLHTGSGTTKSGRGFSVFQVFKAHLGVLLMIDW